jgi:hypothetical protein
MSINARIKELEDKIIALEAKTKDLSASTEQKYRTPVTIGGGSQAQGNTSSISISSGFGAIKGGPVLWNDKEINAPYGTQPAIPTIGYNKHAHSRFSGGALIKDVIEIVEYEWGSITNKHSQGFLKPEDQPLIAKEKNLAGQQVDKIGLLSLMFNPNGGVDSNNEPIGTWGVAAYEIDVTKCYFVEKVTKIDGNNPTVGAIKKDSKGHEMKSALYNEDQTKSAVIWDKNAQVWRFYAVYSPGETTP